MLEAKAVASKMYASFFPPLLSLVSSAKVLEKAGVEADPSVKLAAHLENGKRLRRNATSSMLCLKSHITLNTS